MRRISLALLIALVGVGGYLLGAASPAPALLAQQPTEQCFPETGKCIRGAFLTYWRANGALRQQGLPISDEFPETQAPPPAGDGKTYTVQYFERSRFELHPEFAGTPNEVLLGLLGSEQFRVKYPSGPPTGSPAPPPPPAPAPAPPPPPPSGEAAPQRFSGTGQQVTPPFPLQAGLSIVRLTHAGQRNFITTLLDANGQRVDGLTNVIGPFDGAAAVAIERAGDYLIQVQADGGWTIVVDQPRPTSAPSPPQTFTGRGQQVSPFFQLAGGLTTFRLRHSGQRNFIVTLLDKDGRRSEGLVNEIGAFDGSKAVGGKTGIFLLEIQADGDWTISVE